MRLAVFASGQGTNLKQAYEWAQGHPACAFEVGLVISNNSDSGALSFAKEKGIHWRHHSATTCGGDPARLGEAHLEALDSHEIDFIALAGYMKRIPAEILEAYHHKILNVHPALLPSFGGGGMYGRRVHEAVLARGCKVTGATVHFVTGDYDTGPILMQEACAVLDDDTPESLADRVLAIEHRIFPEAIDLVASGRVRIEGMRTIIG